MQWKLKTMITKSADFVKFCHRFSYGMNGMRTKSLTSGIIILQVIASTVKNFLLLDLGLSIAFPTIVIPALTGLNDTVNPDETVHITAAQASWLGNKRNHQLTYLDLKQCISCIK